MKTVAAMDNFRENVLRYLAEPYALSQRAVAERAGIHFTHLNKILHGDTVPSVTVAEKIAEAIGSSLDLLVKKIEKVSK